MRILPAIAAILLASPALAATRDYPVAGPFDQVVNTTPLNVRVHAGPAALRATGAAEWLDRLQLTVANGRLVVGARAGRWHWSGEGATVDVTVPALRAVRNQGPGDVLVDQARGDRFTVEANGPGNVTLGTVAVRTLAVTVNGPGDVRASGRAARGELAVHGPGNFNAPALTLASAAVSLTGPGDIRTMVTGEATGALSGPGNITLTGGARCRISHSGPGDVHCG